MHSKFEIGLGIFILRATIGPLSKTFVLRLRISLEKKCIVTYFRKIPSKIDGSNVKKL